MEKKIRINFIAFIIQNDIAIFGSENSKKGPKNIDAYRKQMNALDMKMNEFINQNNAMSKDSVFLLGLFDMAINQFGISVKTDVERYKDSFFKFLSTQL